MSSTPSTASWEVGGAFDLHLEVLDDRPGYIAFRVTGRDAERAFKNEAGGHRWQRIPPTEKRGRVHSSSVTVAVLREPTEAEVYLDPRDLHITACRGSGAGGQHRNTTDSAVQVTHKPTGLKVRAESERSQHQNKASALALLRLRLQEAEQERLLGARNGKRRKQVGSGMRGDKVRTIALQRDQVTDHRTGKSMRAKRYLRGFIEDLW